MGIAGQGENGRLAPLLFFPLPHEANRGVAIHDRHLNIHEDEVVPAGLKLLDACRTVFRPDPGDTETPSVRGKPGRLSSISSTSRMFRGDEERILSPSPLRVYCLKMASSTGLSQLMWQPSPVGSGTLPRAKSWRVGISAQIFPADSLSVGTATLEILG